MFLKSLTTRGLVGVGVFAIAFAVLFLNLRLAVRGPDRSYTVFPGGGPPSTLITPPSSARVRSVAVALCVVGGEGNARQARYGVRGVSVVCRGG